MNKELEEILVKCFKGTQKIRDVEKLVKSLTPPTADEVCKALSEYYKTKVIHERGIFYKNAGGNTYDIVILNELFNTPHLITMIGRFYEGVVDSE